MKLRHRAVTAGIALALCGAVSLTSLPATVAYADPASDLAAAAAQLDALGAELAGYQERLATATTELEATDYAIAETQAQVESTSQQLSEKQAALGESMKSTYKTGSEGLLDFILGSTSAEDLANRVYYLDKISEQKAAAIEEVRTLAEQLSQEMSDLQSKQQTQQQQVDDLQSQVDAYQSRVAEATSYYEALDAEVQAQLAEQAAENENVSNAIDTIENGQSQGGGQTQQPSEGTGGDNGGGQVTDDPTPTPDPEPTPTPDPEPDPEPSVPAGGGLATAYAQLGKPYVYGAAGPDAFDCSGLICYSYGYARGRTTYAMISSLQASGDWKTSMDELAVGDLVFPHSGHVGIYLGNGTYLHAANPGSGVVIGQLYSFYGGGSYY